MSLTPFGRFTTLLLSLRLINIILRYLPLHTCFASVVYKSIYMHFTYIFNICQEAYDMCSYFHSDLLIFRLLPPFEVCFAFLDKCPHTFAHILSGEQQEEILAFHF